MFGAECCVLCACTADCLAMQRIFQADRKALSPKSSSFRLGSDGAPERAVDSVHLRSWAAQVVCRTCRVESRCRRRRDRGRRGTVNSRNTFVQITRSLQNASSIQAYLTFEKDCRRRSLTALLEKKARLWRCDFASNFARLILGCAASSHVTSSKRPFQPHSNLTSPGRPASMISSMNIL